MALLSTKCSFRKYKLISLEYSSKFVRVIIFNYDSLNIQLRQLKYGVSHYDSRDITSAHRRESMQPPRAKSLSVLTIKALRFILVEKCTHTPRRHTHARALKSQTLLICYCTCTVQSEVILWWQEVLQLRHLQVLPWCT